MTDQPRPERTAASQPVMFEAQRMLFTFGYDQVADDLARREQEVGIPNYGQPLMTHDGRDTYREGYEEALDLIVYLKKWSMEGSDGPRERQVRRHALVVDAMQLAERVRSEQEGA